MKSLWTLSSLCVLASVVAIVYLIAKDFTAYDPDQGQIATPEAVAAFEERYRSYSSKEGYGPPFFVPTGVFLQSLKFEDSNTVEVTGYLWQVYDDHLHQGIDRGFVFPEQVISRISEAYRRRSGSRETIGWYFEAKLRQNFDYQKYPFDHEVVWLRIWHKDFDENVVLIPHLEAYEQVYLDSTFGIEEEIVLGGFTISETFFDYHYSNYDTDFGIPGYVGQSNFPELYYNVLIKRNYIDTLFVHILPIFAISAFLFSLLVQARFINISNILTISTAMLFGLLLSHQKLRVQVLTHGIVYIEYIYLIMYGAVIYAFINATAIHHKYESSKGTVKLKWPAQLFLPALFFGILCVTVAIF